MQVDGEAIAVARVAHGLQARCQAGGIAVLTTWADLLAASYWVPSGVRPLDAGLVTQIEVPPRLRDYNSFAGHLRPQDNS